MVTKINEFRLMLESATKLKKYIGQCDNLRKQCHDNEQMWHDMMANKVKISFEKFIKNVDMTPILDKGETPMSYIDYSMKSDPDTAVYLSKWGEDEAMFLQTAGFEFIFV